MARVVIWASGGGHRGRLRHISGPGDDCGRGASHIAAGHFDVAQRRKVGKVVAKRSRQVLPAFGRGRERRLFEENLQMLQGVSKVIEFASQAFLHGTAFALS